MSEVPAQVGHLPDGSAGRPQEASSGYLPEGLRVAPWAERGACGGARVVHTQSDGESVWLFASVRVGQRSLAALRVLEVHTSLFGLLARTGWGATADAGATLALRIRGPAFEALSRQAIHAVYPAGLYPSKQAWRLATRFAQVMVGWSAEATPSGSPGREVAYLTLKDDALRDFLARDVLASEDLTGWVQSHRGLTDASLKVPVDAPHPFADPSIAARLGSPDEEER